MPQRKSAKEELSASEESHQCSRKVGSLPQRYSERSWQLEPESNNLISLTSSNEKCY